MTRRLSALAVVFAGACIALCMPFASWASAHEETSATGAIADDGCGPEASASLDRFCARREVHWGVGVEPAFRLSREEGSVGIRAVGRLNYAGSRGYEVRVDLLLGGFPTVHTEFADHAPGALSFGAGVRVDLQLNLGSIYTLSLGPDVVWTFAGGLVGGHVSILGFRFGTRREFFLNFPQQLWVDIDVDEGLILEQLFSLSYLFGV